jgi:hypothetical protein
MFEQMTLFGMINATSSLASVDGVSRSGSQDGPTIGQSGRDRVRASRSASRAKALEPQTIATSGPSSPSSFASADLQRSLESRLRQRLAGLGSPLYALTWKEWAMQSGPPICALRASGRRTSDSGCSGSGWPTPDASAFEAKDIGRMMERRAECRARTGNGNGFGLTLGQAVAALAGWSTPIVNDATGSTHCYGPIKPDGSRPVFLKLPGQARLASGWRTPEASDWNMEASAATVLRRIEVGRQVSTAMQAKLTGPYASGCPVQTGQAGRLNPELPRWLMGYPAAWGLAAAEASPAGQPPSCAVGSSGATATPSSPSSRPSSS